MAVYRPMTTLVGVGCDRTSFRTVQHRLDEPTRSSLGMVASLQCQLLFHLARYCTPHRRQRMARDNGAFRVKLPSVVLKRWNLLELSGNTRRLLPAHEERQGIALARRRAARRDEERMICCALREDLLVELSSSPARAASITCSWSRRGSRSRCPSRSLAWAGGRSSPCRSFLLRRRTDRRHRTRAPKRSLRGGISSLSRTSPVRGSTRLKSLSSPSQAPCRSSSSIQVTLVTAVGLDRAKNRPCLGIDLMDLPVPILPHPERPFGPREPESPPRPGVGIVASTRPVFGSIFWIRSSAS